MLIDISNPIKLKLSVHQLSSCQQSGTQRFVEGIARIAAATKTEQKTRGPSITAELTRDNPLSPRDTPALRACLN